MDTGVQHNGYSVQVVDTGVQHNGYSVQEVDTGVQHNGYYSIQVVSGYRGSTQWVQRTGSGYRGSNIYLFCIISFYMIIFPYFQSTQLNLFFAFVIYYLNKSVFRKKCSPKREIIDLLFVPFFLFFYYFVFTLHNSS